MSALIYLFLALHFLVEFYAFPWKSHGISMESMVFQQWRYAVRGCRGSSTTWRWTSKVVSGASWSPCSSPAYWPTSSSSGSKYTRCQWRALPWKHSSNTGRRSNGWKRSGFGAGTGTLTSTARTYTGEERGRAAMNSSISTSILCRKTPKRNSRRIKLWNSSLKTRSPKIKQFLLRKSNLSPPT